MDVDPSAKISLNAIATCVPDNEITQDDVLKRAHRLFNARTPIFEKLESVFENAEIATRYTCLPDQWFEQESDFEEKNELFEHHATTLAKQATIKALEDARLDVSDIEAIVFVSSTGIATPSIDARLINQLGFKNAILRLPIFCLGCAGGVLGLSRAIQLSQATGKRILIVVLELCTLAYRYDKLTKSNIVATALFGDGAAAIIISPESRNTSNHVSQLGTFGTSGEHTWNDTLNIMGWRVDKLGFDVVFHRQIPEFVSTHYSSALSDFLTSQKLNNSDIDRPCCHPGGAKVIAALEQVFNLSEGELDAERRILRDYGNMSSPTVLFVLKDLIKHNAHGRLLLSALGPGFSVGFQELFLGETT